jgi:hypothetical protein
MCAKLRLWSRSYLIDPINGVLSFLLFAGPAKRPEVRCLARSPAGSPAE